LNVLNLAPPVFFLLQLLTAQIFSFFMPDRLVVRAGNNAQTITRRLATWLGPLVSLLVSLIAVAAHVAMSTQIIIQAALYIVMLYVFLVNLGARRRS